MGGDLGPATLVPATLDFLAEHPAVNVILTGDEATIRAELPDNFESLESRVTVRHCEQVVAMDETPTKAMRTKKNSSMRVALDLV